MFNQKNFFKTIAVSGLTVLISVVIIYGVVRAGSLTPPGTPAATSYTLDDIYNRLNSNTPATAGNHSFTAPGSTSTPTMYDLTQIYNKIPTINPNNLLSSTTYLGITGSIVPRGAFGLTASSSSQSVLAGYYTGGTLAGDVDLAAANIKSGVNVFGIDGSYGGGGYAYGSDISSYVLTSAGAGAGTWNATNLLADKVATSTAFGTSSVGTLLGHLFNGTYNLFIGGSQDNGGVEDYKNGGTAPLNTYSKGWTLCDAGNIYCGTSDSGAAYKDNSTGLIWSKTLNVTTYAMDDSAGLLTWYLANNCTESSGSTCTKKSSAQTGCEANPGWFLPHQKQFLQAYIDGSYGNLEAIGNSRTYCSATGVSDDSGNIWKINLSRGSCSADSRGSTYAVRCVR